MKEITFEKYINSAKKSMCLASQKIKNKKYDEDNHTANYLKLRLSSITKQIKELKQLAEGAESEEKKIKK